MRWAVLSTLSLCLCACSGPSRPDPIDPSNDQVAGACGYSVRRGDTTKSVVAAGATLTIPVTTTSGSAAGSCTWTVAMTDAARAFMTLVDPESGSSSAAQTNVTFTVAPNNGAQRQATVNIANVPFTITQAAAACALSIGGDLNASFPAGGGTGHVTITRAQGAACAWSATSNATFITVTPAGGTDDGVVTFTVTPNTGQSRSGTLTIAGQTVTVTQAGVNAVVPSITSVAPSALSVGVTTTITVSGAGFDPSTAQFAVTGPGCPSATPCIVTTAELTTRTPAVLAGPVTLRNTGVFTIQVQNGQGTPLSNGVTVTVGSTPATVPLINSIAPTQITVGGATLSISGSGFDPSSVQVAVTGPGCPGESPCLVPNAQLTARSATQLAAPVSLLTAGTYTIQVQNGSGAPLSNGVTLTVSPAPAPSIASVSPTTVPVGVRTFLTIAGSNFDPASAQLAVVGPGCMQAPCIVANSEMTTRTATQLAAPVTLGTAGSFTIQVQNGGGGALSNAVSITVR